MESFKDVPVESILSQVSQDDVVYLGGGEPMLHLQIERLVEKLIEIPSRVVVSTNGIIYRKMPQETQLQISVWTLNPELYKEITKGSEKQLEKVRGNIRRYVSDGNPVILNMPVYEKNISEINSVSDHAHLLSVPLRINSIFPANGFSNSPDLERRIEDCVFDLKLKGREIIYSRIKPQVQRYFLKI